MTKKDLITSLGQAYTDQMIEYANRVKAKKLHPSKAKKWNEATLITLTIVQQLSEKELSNLLAASKKSKSPLFVQAKLF